MVWLLGYCGLCWLASLLVLRPLNQQFTCAERTELEAQTFSRGAIFTLLVLTAPAWLVPALAWFAWQLSGCLWNGLRLCKLAGQYREPQFAALEPSEFDEQVRECFDEQAGEFTAHGFQPCGDYFNQPAPFETFNRYFLGCSGAVVGDLSLTMGTCGPGMFSILADGTYIETAPIEPLTDDVPLLEDQLVVNYAGALTIAELIQSHVEFVAAQAEERHTQVLSFSGEQIPAAAVYGYRRFYHWRRRLGEITSAVPEPELPSGTRLAPAQLADALLATTAG